MKALSLRQPWAELLVNGQKTLELRSWKTTHRGPVAIHASLTVNEAACRKLGLDPAKLTTGAIIGVVDLVDIFELDPDQFAQRANEHLAVDFVEPPVYAWQIANPRALEAPIPYRGAMSLFAVPDRLLERGLAPEVKEPVVSRPPEQNAPMNGALDVQHPFELRILPEPSAQVAQTSYRLVLVQREVHPPAAQRTLTDAEPVHTRQIAEIGGTQLRSIADAVLEGLRHNGYAATDLNLNRREPFRLNEESGVRLGLLFLAVRPITKGNRIEDISRGIRAMTNEELYYWFSKCTTGTTAARALTALRTLLSDE